MAPLQARLHDQIKDSMVLINIKPPKKASVGKNKNDKGIFVMGIAGIRCPNPGGYNTQLMRAVPLCRSVIAKRQRVHLFSPEQMLLTSGTVMGVSGPTFQHNCSTLESSSLGAPVVNDNGHLVGICNDFRNDYLEAISTHAIASEIEMAQGREYIGIGQMLDHLQS
uniref:Uncharacterized protein n=1 Tax=Aegilops tauschii subsp. strangulata TaxID=200361 RepID=A0A453LPR9_AEGTS